MSEADSEKESSADLRLRLLGGEEVLEQASSVDHVGRLTTSASHLRCYGFSASSCFHYCTTGLRVFRPLELPLYSSGRKNVYIS